MGASVIAGWMALTGPALAEKFVCSVPWTGETNCASKFSIPAEHTLTITVTSVTDSDGKDDTEKCPVFKLKDLNAKDPDAGVATITVCPGHAGSFKNTSTKSELIIQMTVNIDRTFKRAIKGETKITK